MRGSARENARVGHVIGGMMKYPPGRRIQFREMVLAFANRERSNACNVKKAWTLVTHVTGADDVLCTGHGCWAVQNILVITRADENNALPLSVWRKWGH